MLFTGWRALHTSWKTERIWKVICTEYAWRKSIYKNMESHLHRMCMTKTHIQRNGSHSHRNVQRKSIQKEMVVIRTETCMTTIHSKEMVVIRTEMCIDENRIKKKWFVIGTEMHMTTIHSKRIGKSFAQKCTWRKSIQKEMVVIRTEM